MAKQNTFKELLKFVHSGIILKWIPDLTYKTVKPPGEKSEGDEVFFADKFSTGLQYQNHCLKIGKEYFVFSVSMRTLSARERAFIDWSVDKTAEYAKLKLDYPLRDSLKEIIPRVLISVCLSFPDYDLSFSWKHLNGHITYFGPTAELYNLEARELFTEEDLTLSHVIYDLLSSVEHLCDSTSEGASFTSTIAFVNAYAEKHGPVWKDIASEDFIKCLAGNNTVFLVSCLGRLVDYIDITTADINEEFAGALGNAADLSSGHDDDYIFNFIFNFQIENPYKDIFFLSTKENGDIFIYKNRSVLFFRRSKVWHFLNYKAISDIVSSYTGALGQYYGDAINLTIVDMLLDHSGCCLGLIPFASWVENFDHIIGTGKVDVFLSSTPSVSRYFWSNTRIMRRRMLSIDGAVLLSAEDGEIYNVGAIIPNSGASSQGARTTATQTIARLGGIAIKISDDGYCEIYEPGKSRASFIIGK